MPEELPKIQNASRPSSTNYVSMILRYIIEGSRRAFTFLNPDVIAV
jgi:hypothetical protein